MTDDIKLILADSVITVQSYIFGKIVEEQMTVAELIKRYTKTGEVPYADPVKHGHWIITYPMDSVRGYWTKCSNCNTVLFGGGRYCGKCGAKMDEDGEQE